MTTAIGFCIALLILSLITASTSKQVANFIAPKKESTFAIPRTMLSVFWFTFVPFLAYMVALIAFIVLLLLAFAP